VGAATTRGLGDGPATSARPKLCHNARDSASKMLTFYVAIDTRTFRTAAFL